MGWGTGAKVSLSVLGALGLGPLIAVAIKRWADQNGYIDDPTNGLQTALAKVAAITDHWLFYPGASFFVGLSLGLWIDALLRDRGAERKAALALLGYDLREFSDFIVDQAGRINERWPMCVLDRMPDLQALLSRAQRAGLPVPPPKAMQLNDNGEHLANYLQYVGTFLIHNQFAEAKNAALQWNTAIAERHSSEL
jgi:hypothetical protein